MDQKLEGTPKATLRLEGRKIIRSEVTNNWGTRLQWKISRDGKEIATVFADAGADLRQLTPRGEGALPLHRLLPAHDHP